MKFDDKKPLGSPQNLKTVQEHLKAGDAGVVYQGLLCVIADCVDRALSGKDTYAIVGLTRDRSALLLTVTEGTAKARAGGLDLAEVSSDAERLL